MKNALYFILKAAFVLEVFTFLFWLFAYVEKRLDEKAMVNFKIYDAKQWTTNNYNTHITQYLNQTMKFDQLIKQIVKNIFLQKSCRKLGRETSSRPLFAF